MPFVNLTPHVLNIINGSDVLALPASGQSVRVAQRLDSVCLFDSVTCYRAVYGNLETIDNATKAVVGGLPEPVEGTLYIVSGQALEALKALGRSDFAAPGELVRDDKGQPVGCKGLRVN